MRFYVNDIRWTIEYVDPFDTRLVDTSGLYRIATTDPMVHGIFIVSGLSRDFGRRALVHELVHCYIISYRLEKLAYSEEFLCNFVADFGSDILRTADWIEKEIR